MSFARASLEPIPALMARVRETRGAVDVTVALALAALMAAVFGPYVAHGGLTSDDWGGALVAQRHGYFEAAHVELDNLRSRPLLAVLTPLPHALFGDHVHAQLALALALGLLTVIAFYLVLRRLTLRAHEAATIAALLVLFPWSDSARLWVTGSLNQVALILYLLGLLVALGALRRTGRSGVAVHCVAALLYAAAVLTYEAVGALALLTGGLYLLFAPRRRALARWAIDVVAVGGAIAYTRTSTEKVIKPFSDQLHNAIDMGRGAVSLFTHALVPADLPHEIVELAVLGVLAYAVTTAVLNPRDAELRRWLAVFAIAVVAVGAGYALFVPAAYWTPQHPNLENRVNTVAALGMVVLVYGLLRIAALLLVRRASAIAAAVSAVAIAAGYVVMLRGDESRWEQASAEQRQVLAAIQHAVPQPRPGDRIFSFGARAQVAQNLPVFFDSWDLWSAVRFEYGGRGLSAYPVFAGAQLACAQNGVSVVSLPSPSPNTAHGFLTTQSNHEPASTAYGRVWFVDATRSIGRRIDSRTECRNALPKFPPGGYQ